MTNKIFMDELLTDEQLALVSGGTDDETDTDEIFFRKLGYRAYVNDVEEMFALNGVKYVYNLHNHTTGKNSYSIKINGEWCQHPHFAVLGYILKQRNYPGFNGNWTDRNYVKGFLGGKMGVDVRFL